MDASDAAGSGRPAHEPSPEGRKRVEAMAACGISEADIATVLEIDPKTLRKHYRHELDTGHIKANAKVAASLLNKALGDGKGAVTAAIWWTKTRMGWSETNGLQLSGPGGGPVVVQAKDDEHRARALAALLAKVEAGQADV